MWSKGEDKTIARPLGNEKGMGALETLLVCILVGILIGTVIPYYEKLAQEGKEVALQTGLANIRKAIELYQALQGENPESLKSMVYKRYVVSTKNDTLFSGEYLHAQTEDAEGNLLDPFGNRYRYDGKKGRVSSGTKGYEMW